MTRPIIVWFRQDLRRKDNTALIKAYEEGAPILPLYILEDEDAGERKIGAAARWWLHQSLKSLDSSLSGHLYLAKGKAKEIIETLVKDTNAKAVYWNRCYEKWRIDRDKDIKEALSDMDIGAKSFNASLLWEPWEALKEDGAPYKVFTPFYKKDA